METPTKYVGLKDAMALLSEQGIKVRRQRYAKTSVLEYLESLTDDMSLKNSLLGLYRTYEVKFETVCAGAKHHHWWEGGLEDHCREMIGLGLDLMELYTGDLTGFTRDELIIAVFLHDFSKVFMYRKITATERERVGTRFHPKQAFTYQEGATHILDAEQLTATTLMRLFVPISDKIWSAVCYAEGGYSKGNFGYAGARTTTGSRVNHENPLAAFLAILDMYSAMMLGRELR